MSTENHQAAGKKKRKKKKPYNPRRQLTMDDYGGPPYPSPPRSPSPPGVPTPNQRSSGIPWAPLDLQQEGSEQRRDWKSERIQLLFRQKRSTHSSYSLSVPSWQLGQGDETEGDQAGNGRPEDEIQSEGDEKKTRDKPKRVEEAKERKSRVDEERGAREPIEEKKREKERMDAERRTRERAEENRREKERIDDERRRNEVAKEQDEARGGGPSEMSRGVKRKNNGGSDCDGSGRQKVRSLPIKETGRLFGGLEPVQTDPEVDPPPRGCMNCWSYGHYSRHCPWPRKKFCDNCGRAGVVMTECGRCRKAALRYLRAKGERRTDIEAGQEVSAWSDRRGRLNEILNERLAQEESWDTETEEEEELPTGRLRSVIIRPDTPRMMQRQVERQEPEEMSAPRVLEKVGGAAKEKSNKNGENSESEQKGSEVEEPESEDRLERAAEGSESEVEDQSSKGPGLEEEVQSVSVIDEINAMTNLVGSLGDVSSDIKETAVSYFLDRLKERNGKRRND